MTSTKDLYSNLPPGKERIEDSEGDQLKINADGSLPTSIILPSTLTGGDKAVTTAGTAEALAASLSINSVYVRAKVDNTGNVYIGDSSVDKTTNKQIILAPGDETIITIDNIATVYVDVDTNGEGVDYLATS